MNFVQKLVKSIQRNNIHSKLAWYFAFGLGVITLFKNWPSLLKLKFAKTDKKIVAKLRNGLTFVVENPGDISVIVEIFLLEAYAVKQVKDVKTIIDVGAHQGSFSIYSATTFEKAQVYSYEPFIKNFNSLKKNISENKLKNIHPTNKGVLDSETTLSFYESKINSGGHSIFNYEKNMKKHVVKTTTIKKIFEDNKLTKCDILKLDCEGSEYRILLEMDLNTLSKIRTIFAEIHEDLQKEHTNKELLTFLRKNGFKVDYRKGKILVAKRK
jgi:FkbM family methyltransferase